MSSSWAELFHGTRLAGCQKPWPARISRSKPQFMALPFIPYPGEIFHLLCFQAFSTPEITHSSPSHVAAQTLPLLQNLFYLPLTQLQQGGSSFSCNPTVPKVVGRGWLRSPLFNLLISDIPQNWFNKSCLLKWKPGRQKLFLLFRCLPENSAAKYFCAAPKASPETFHVSLYTSSSLSSSFYLHI